MAQRVYDGQLMHLAVWIGTADVGETGHTVTCRIKRLSDSNYYAGGGAWQVAATTIAMGEEDATNFPGLYTYINLVAALADDDYRVQYICADVSHPIDMGEIWEVDQIATEILFSAIDYIDTDGTVQSTLLWKMISGLFSVSKREMIDYVPPP
jgi:hypothetical protein